MKKAISLLLALVALFSCLSATAFADYDIIYLDDGYYIVYTLEQEAVIQPNSVNETRVVKGSRTGYLYNSSDEMMASVTLNATFQYDGTSAEATKATYNYHVYADDWRFDSGQSYCSGNQAIARVVFNAPVIDKALTVTITCSPDGELS